MDVSIVIVSYNTCRILDECIASIIRETRCSYEIIVVDNASSDDSCLMLREKYPQVRLLENQENAGFARANNQGFAAAAGKYFFLLNSDTVILDGAIDKLLLHMESNTNIGICGPRNLGRDGSLQPNCDHFPSVWNTFCYYSGLSGFFPRSSLFNRCWMRYWDYAEARDVDRMSGCSLLIRSDLYRNLNGLDESFFMYFEETDLCYRSQARGERTTYFPDAEIIHYGGESSKGNTTAVVRNKTVWSYFYTSQYYYFVKNYGLTSMLAIRALDLSYGVYLLLRSMLRTDPTKRINDRTIGVFMITTASSGTGNSPAKNKKVTVPCSSKPTPV